MKLKVKVFDILTGGPFVAVLHKEDAQLLDIVPSDRVRVRNSEEVVCIADITSSKEVLHPGEVGVFLDLARELDIQNGEELEVLPELKPKSLFYIKKKLDGIELTKNEINEVIRDAVDNTLTEIETTFFVSACYTEGMTMQESAYLTEAIVENGGRLEFKNKKVLDKHCVGGIPGNRTTMIVVPIIAAAGFTIPKTSTRSITSPAGTSDTMEVLAPVAHTKQKILEIVKKTKGCMVWGGTLDLASADDILIKIERPLSLDPEGVLLASILAKKVAAGSTHVLVDIPLGKEIGRICEAKFCSKREAKNLAKKFIALGKRLGIKVETVITDGSQPIGNGIGPALEARDVLSVLEGQGPKDLKEKSLFLAGNLLRMAKVKNADKKAKELLDSGAALVKMKEIIAAQGGNPAITSQDIEIGKYEYEVKAKKKGKIIHVSNSWVTRIAKAAGAPNDKGAGIYLCKKKGDRVEKGELVLTVYADSKDKLEHAKSMINGDLVKIS